jgi:hypothetical protein
MQSAKWATLVALAFVPTGCSSPATTSAFDGGSTRSTDGGMDGSRPSDAPRPVRDTGALSTVDSSPGGGCEPPDVLFVLDRSLSMAQVPSTGGYPSVANDDTSKFYLAVKAIDTIVTPADAGAPIDQSIRFGLEVLPITQTDKDAGIHNCGDLAQVIAATQDNFSGFAGDPKYCQKGGDVVVTPAHSGRERRSSAPSTRRRFSSAAAPPSVARWRQLPRRSARARRQERSSTSS